MLKSMFWRSWPPISQADLEPACQPFWRGLKPPRQPGRGKQLTACVFGAIPPFSFHPDLTLVADLLLFERFDEIANAGLEKSVIMDTQ